MPEDEAAPTASLTQALDGGTTFKPLNDDVKFSTLERKRIVDLGNLVFDEKPLSPKFCWMPAPITVADVNVDRSLFVHDRATLDAADFSLNRTLTKIAADAVAAGATGTTANSLFRDFWDTQNTAAGAATPGGAQCDDNGGTLNGFQNPCRPTEGAQAFNPATEIGKYTPIALVNRLDLASEGGKNCGEHRIIYGRNDGSRNFIIFEAVLPNPRPGCADACRPVAKRWFDLSATASAATRAAMLEELFYTGLPGFRPVVHVEHYAVGGTSSTYGGSGSGQIRTNMFMSGPWTLKEFKLAIDCTTSPCVLDPVPVPVAVNPNGFLWSESTDPLATAFQSNAVTQVSALASTDLNTIGYGVAQQFNDSRADSQTGGPRDNYVTAYNSPPSGPFHTNLSSAASGVGLTDVQVVRRALTQSCAGCHQPSSFGLTGPNSLGLSMSWPNALSFVHINEFPSGGVHQLSPALTNVFLPARAQHLVDRMNDLVCPCVSKFVSATDLSVAVRPFNPPFRTIDEVVKTQASVESQMAQKGTPVIELSKTAKGQVFPSVRQAGQDVRKAGVLRQQDVWRAVEQEPLRKTVTGTFRTH
ncbi:MAG: hypothetical protein DI536_26505 [Archangium gephyra]|uniref:Uncharacterized protein n=1 Tax=Archangium gephyra TaxID=48 RepID=A0A2W5UG28_9BACT|nr:MAG: hypothetical protein DI536_26505 [Archangium gephyra]